MRHMELCATPHWYPVLRSRELRGKPLGRMRFGINMVFWRAADGRAIALRDRCPHRGAALSLGQVDAAGISCPFHGFCFDTEGQCVRTPPEGDRPIPADLRAQSYITTEENGYIWIWRGAADADKSTPPTHDVLQGLNYGESVSIWEAHYTRCIENVCDFSHLPFVHKTTIGLFRKEMQTDVEIEALPDGMRAWLIDTGKRGQCFEFIYPNLWLLRVERSLLLSAVFVPINAQQTEVYSRSYVQHRLPGTRLLLDLYTRLSQYLVFREDWPIVASQDPGDSNTAGAEKLLASDAPIIAYRKLHRSYMRDN
jgi:phenylpropionate dioxygenase-like ring-hydroxylating dioxygenase large terminal subunit